MYIKLILDCTNTKILMYCIYLQYTPSVRYYLHTLYWCRHTYMTFPPPGLQTKMRLQRRLREIYLLLFSSSENFLFKNLFASLNTVRNTELTFKSYFFTKFLKKSFPLWLTMYVETESFLKV